MDSTDPAATIRIVAGVLAVAVVVAMLLVAIFYVLTLSRALEKCSARSRTMQPGMVWLLFIPLFNMVWHFFVVLALARSLSNEFRARNVQNVEPEPGKSIGIAMCICGACAIVPLLNIVAGLAQLVLGIIYWNRIAGFSRKLDSVPAMSAGSNLAPRA